MHRNRTWSFLYSTWRLSRNRILSVDGVFSAVTFLQFFPSTIFGFNGSRDVLIQTFTLSGISEPISFSWFGFSSNQTTFSYKKNNDPDYIEFPPNTNTVDLFSNGDTISIVFSTGKNSTGLNQFTLKESLTDSVCSNTLSLQIL
jgi:hypothetical protein